MFIAKVTGTVVATQKVSTVTGKKLLLVEAMTIKGEPPALQSSGRIAVAVDTVGAGEGELVIVTQGSSARLTDLTSNVPTDAVVIGIIDAIQAGGQTLFNKQS
ncbi:MAG TPA: EutN/CcmL family microcompartment protein [Phycisphaerae bacterium]|nr:EutN/CcmL family microcompartment protein [Phycisphaerae bacterium]HOJ72864.1 EutN/CcmL family microcompartment protein [Phycisphaerae bacterium]HOM51709.1 EutN/CcmL family microcompartment protein [Phycisphaerae bacterium]HON66896.1 EutN/CcmL family microcompartment protein [Phycisphaerae bacterium]HPP28784.1 EutN/CcmL family microcompartment protein [Phycisphaerae bacterium]